MTQCILSHILSEEHQINKNRLETFYEDCLNKDEALDELQATEDEKVYRRQLEFYQQTKGIIELCFSFFL